MACLLSALSGMAGLAHQMIWTRRLVDLMGASPFTFSKVVGAFFLGLAAGSALAAVRLNNARRPWRWVACIEFLVALLALPVLLTPELANWLYHSPALATWLKYFVPFLFVTPPAVAMGMATPSMIRAIAMTGFPVSQGTVWIYAVNILGGVAGIATVLLFALPKFGLTGAGLLICGLNVFVGVLALLQDRTAKGLNVVPEIVAVSTRNVFSGQNRQLAGLAFCSGFLVLSLEVILQHQFAQVTINSFFSNGTVLAWGLISLAVSSALVPLVAKSRGKSNRLPGMLLLAAACCAVQPFIFTWMRNGVEIFPYELRPVAYAWEVGKLALVALCPVFIASGLLFPFLLHKTTAEAPASAGRRVAVLLGWNGLGGWVGSEISQSFITPYFGLWQSIILLGAGYAALAVFVAPKKNFSWFPIATGAGIVGAFVFGSALPQISLNPGEHLATVKVGREGVVATVECAPGDWRILFNNSYTLGGSKARANQEREAHLPILLHGHARSIAILGVASGGTVAGATLHSELERIDAAELSPLVLQQARQFFTPYSRTVFNDSRVHLIQEDARWMVATKENTYDVVVGDLFLPWRTGEARLFSVEHFQAVRRALKSDGVFCQWLPLFQLTRAQFDAISRSFQEVFPDAMVVRGDFYTELPIVGLVGGRDLEKLNWKEIADGCSRLRLRGDITDPLVRHEEGLAMMLVGELPSPAKGPVNTLGNAWLEWDCGKNIVGMASPWFIGVPEAEYLQEIQRTAQCLIPPALQEAHDSGQFFLTLEIAAKLRLPQYYNFAEQIPARLPAAMREDREVSWQEWPTRVKPKIEYHTREMPVASLK